MYKGESTKYSSKSGMPKVTNKQMKQIIDTPVPNEEKERKRLKELEEKYTKTKGRDKL